MSKSAPAMLVLSAVIAQAPLPAFAAPPANKGTAEPAASNLEAPDTPVGRQLRWTLQWINTGQAPPDLADRFTDTFKKAVPIDALPSLGVQLHEFTGELEVTQLNIKDETSLVGVVTSHRNGVQFQLTLAVEPDEPHRINAMVIQPSPQLGVAGVDNWSQLDAKLDAEPGDVSLAAFEVETDDALAPVHAFNADAQLAIGSSFKLYVLGALAELIEEGKANWDDPLAIREELKSLPSGDMRKLEAGVTKPVSEFADQMISVSDNTAADHLIALVGRDRIERFVVAQGGETSRTFPFLTTLEMFTIKLANDATLAQRYADADLDARRRLLADVVDGAKPSFDRATAWTKPIQIGKVEWFASTPQLCKLMTTLASMSLRDGLAPISHALTINSGFSFDRSLWTAIAYKGGSEPGVLNMTWLLERRDGRSFTISFTVNNPDAVLDAQLLYAYAGTAVHLLGEQQ